MSSSVRNPSKRFRRAAEAERSKLLNEHRRLAADHERLLAEARRVEASMQEVDSQVRALTEMLGTEGDAEQVELPVERAQAIVEHLDGLNAARLLAGPAIREVAVQVLLRQPEYIEAIHYRRWYELLTEAGYAVAGKNPHAVFLTQLSRSPVVCKSGQSGVYELDRQAPLRLRQRFERLQSELLDLSSTPVGDGAANANATKRRELTSAISQTEKALEEALRVLRREQSEPAGSPELPPMTRLSA